MDPNTSPTTPPASAQEFKPAESGIDCFQIVLFGVFLLGTALMFTKTTDLMAAFAPKYLFGYEGLESVYGIGCALLVDGLVAAMKAKLLFMGRAKNGIEWGYDVILTLFPFTISAFAQVFDSFLIRETLASQPVQIQFFANWFIPSIPTLVILGVLIYGFIQSAPVGTFKGDMARGASSGGAPSGIRFRIGKMIQQWLYGTGNKTVNPTPASTD